MNKEESLIMKGVAILMMLFLHLFNKIGNVDLCYNSLFVGDTPIVHLLSRACNPVSFFLILSGYGLYIVQSKNKNYNIVKKIRNLYIHYWITLAIFVTIGTFVVGIEHYPGSWQAIISNVTAWHTTWNGEIWFFFPYMLLALTSRYIFKVMDKMNIWLFMGGTLFLAFTTGYCISRYGDAYLYHHWLPYMPVLYFGNLFAFCAGTCMAKYNIVSKLPISNYKCWVLLTLLISLRCCIRTSAFHTFYAIAFIILFVNAPRSSFFDAFLKEMGKRSTSMWFVHTYFCYYLFHDFIYGFKYPIIIFIVLLTCSYLSAIVIDRIYTFIIGFHYRHK